MKGSKINREQMERYRREGSWGTRTLADCWEEAVERYPDREYVVDDRGNRYTYAGLDEKASRVAAYLVSQGIGPGDVVSFQIPIWSEFVIVTVAVLKAGAVVNPMGMCFQGEELSFLLNLAESKIYLCPTWFHKTDYEANILAVREAVPSLRDVVLLENIQPKKSSLRTLEETLEEYGPKLSPQSCGALAQAPASGAPGQKAGQDKGERKTASPKGERSSDGNGPSGGNGSSGGNRLSAEGWSKVFKERRAFVESDDVALLLCTSGTTRGTKAVMLTHNNLIFSEASFNRELGLGKDDIMFMPAPLNHATGFNHGLIAPMLMGAKVVLQERFDCPKAIDYMDREGCTYSMGATPFIYDILKELDQTGKELSSLRFYLCGGAPVPGAMVQRAWGHKILLCEVYGSTESCPHVYVHPEEALALNGTTSGRPVEGVEVRLVDDQGRDVPVGTPGEEISRGPNVFVGYLKDKAATDQSLDDEGWFYSGDICVGDEKGNIRVIGRKKDMIVRGGENLNANDINNDIEGCPGVADHTVIGMPDDRLGERICAYLVLEPGTEKVTREDVIEHFKRQKINKRYWPERVEIIDRLPRTDSGKVKKYLLVEDIKKRMLQDPAEPAAYVDHCQG